MPDTSPLDRYRRLGRAVPRLLLIAWSTALVDVLLDALAFLILAPEAFTAYLAVLVLVELLLTVVAQPAALAATRSVAPLAIGGASTVRLAAAALAVRTLWRVLRFRTVVLVLGLAAASVALRAVDFAPFVTLAVVCAAFVARGRLAVDTGLIAGLLCPTAALSIASLLPAGWALLFFIALLDRASVSPSVLYLVHLIAVGLALAAARYLLFRLSPATNVPSSVARVAPASWSSLRSWSLAAVADRALDALPLVAVLLWADPAAAAAYTLARRVAGVIDTGLIAHVVVRPAAAGVLRSIDLESRTPAAASRELPSVARDALWWTLVVALVLAGPVVASASPIAERLGVPALLFAYVVRVFVVFRLVVVAAGPGAEVLELAGHERVRGRLALAWCSIGVAGALLCAYYSLVVAAAMVACVASAALECSQSRVAWSRVGVDPTVLSYLRSTS